MIFNKLISNIYRIKEEEINNRLSSYLSLYNFNKISDIGESDIVIAGYPKSGNTWMQSLVSGVLYGMDTQFLPDQLAQEIVPDVHYKKYYKRFSDINFFKSHHLPKKEYRKVVYLSRDGRDVMLSYWNFNKIQGDDVGFEKLVVEGKGLFPSKWHEHVEAWCENQYSSDILFVKYEDLLNSAERELKRIFDFAGICREDEVFARAVAGCTFRNMQKKEQQFGFDNRKWQGDGQQKRFFRKGVQGEYKTEFPSDLLSFFENESCNAMKLLGYM